MKTLIEWVLDPHSKQAEEQRESEAFLFEMNNKPRPPADKKPKQS